MGTLVNKTTLKEQSLIESGRLLEGGRWIESLRYIIFEGDMELLVWFFTPQCLSVNGSWPKVNAGSIFLSPLDESGRIAPV